VFQSSPDGQINSVEAKTIELGTSADLLRIVMLKFMSLQLSCKWGFIFVCLVASVPAIVPFNCVQEV
jgi:hypothetical protein